MGNYPREGKTETKRERERERGKIGITILGN
jgi:hypothetical protein